MATAWLVSLSQLKAVVFGIAGALIGVTSFKFMRLPTSACRRAVTIPHVERLHDLAKIVLWISGRGLRLHSRWAVSPGDSQY